MGFSLHLARVFACAATSMSFLAGSALAQSAPAEHLGVPGPLHLADTEYLLGWSSRPADGYIKQEYVPKGQTPQSYRQMLMLEFLSGKMKPLEAARAQVAKLEERKKSDPLVNMNLVQNQATGEVLLDFIVSDKDPQGAVIVEWNAYRYAPHESGLVLFATSHRAYGNTEARSFLQKLKEFRPTQINALVRTPLPAVVAPR